MSRPDSGRTWMSVEKTLHQLLTCELEVGCDFAKDRAKRADLQRVVSRDRYVVLNWLIDGQPNMTAGLARNHITDPPQVFCKLRPG